VFVRTNLSLPPNVDKCIALLTGLYEKVINVKADVSALLNLFSGVSIDIRW